MVAESGKREKTTQNLAPVGAGDGPRWLSHRNAETGGLRVTTAETSANHNPFRQISRNATPKPRGRSKNHTKKRARRR